MLPELANHASELLFGGILALLLGGFLYLWRKRRVFDRTNCAGVEQFSNFRSKIKAKFLEGIAGCVSVLLVIIGILALAFRFVDAGGWLVAFPFVALLLFGLL